jgi:hypothetical protein
MTNNVTFDDTTDLSAHQLVYVPHSALETPVPPFPEGNSVYRMALAVI